MEKHFKTAECLAKLSGANLIGCPECQKTFQIDLKYKKPIILCPSCDEPLKI